MRRSKEASAGLLAVRSPHAAGQKAVRTRSGVGEVGHFRHQAAETRRVAARRAEFCSYPVPAVQILVDVAVRDIRKGVRHRRSLRKVGPTYVRNLSAGEGSWVAGDRATNRLNSIH